MVDFNLIALSLTVIGAIACVAGMVKAFSLFTNGHAHDGLALLAPSVSGIFAVMIVGLAVSLGSPL